MSHEIRNDNKDYPYYVYLTRLIRENDLQTLHAILSGDSSVIHLRHPSSYNDLLGEAIGTRNLAAVKLLIFHGFDPNKYRAGELPLINVVRAGEEDFVEALLEGGADPNLWSLATEKTALMWAKLAGNDNLVRLLKKYGADEQEL